MVLLCVARAFIPSSQKALARGRQIFVCVCGQLGLQREFQAGQGCATGETLSQKGQTSGIQLQKCLSPFLVAVTKSLR